MAKNMVKISFSAIVNGLNISTEVIVPMDWVNLNSASGQKDVIEIVKKVLPLLLAVA